MKKTKFTDEQIIGFLKQAEAGMPIKDICRAGGFSQAAQLAGTYCTCSLCPKAQKWRHCRF